MNMTIRSVDLRELSLCETDLVKSVVQNVSVILRTWRGTVPMYRPFGIDGTLVDLPVPVAKVRMVADLRETIETYEPRFRVSKISFEPEQSTNPGYLAPVVEGEIIAAV